MKTSMTVLLAGACIAGWCAEDMHRHMNRERGIDLPPAVKAAEWKENRRHGLLPAGSSRAHPDSSPVPGLEGK